LERIERFFENQSVMERGVMGGFLFANRVFSTTFRDGDATIFERDPLENLSRDGELYAYKHTGFWKCMDTLRDMQQLNQMWNEGKSKWKIWD